MKRLIKAVTSEFLVVVVAVLYAAAIVRDPGRAGEAAIASVRTFLDVLPIITAVFAALGLFSVWVDKKVVAERLGERSGFGTLVFAALFGTVLVGPVYVIFPLLKAVREHGARWAVVGAVLTAWAVKIPMVPLEMGMLGVRFSTSRLVLVALAAIPLGLLLELAMRSSSDREEHRDLVCIAQEEGVS
ncbi:MAG: hypothetical protein JXP37_07030 [Coriobacteriia bacterium]|nr:hypothetical protein [Coriobacteriia bacterium]